MTSNKLKIGHFSSAPQSALGTVDRVIVFNNLEVGHLSKQQVVAFQARNSIAVGKSAC
jgi:hypothetical protein